MKMSRLLGMVGAAAWLPILHGRLSVSWGVPCPSELCAEDARLPVARPEREQWT